jgi:sporulation protein YlmC with PRC-barrel domain
MSTNGFLAYDKDSFVVRPLTELPMLRLADRARDVRGWDVYGRDGRRLGIVVDLLVDIDRLRADTLLVSPAGSDHAGAMVEDLNLMSERENLEVQRCAGANQRTDRMRTDGTKGITDRGYVTAPRTSMNSHVRDIR